MEEGPPVCTLTGCSQEGSRITTWFVLYSVVAFVFVVLTGLNVAGFAQCICRLESGTKIARNSSNVGRSQLDDVREGMRSSRQSIMLPARNSLPKCSHDLEGTS